MRVLLLTPEYPPATSLGGIATNTLSLAHVLSERGHDVGVVTPATESSTVTEHGVTVVRVRSRWIPGRDVRRVATRRAYAAAALRFRPDVVHSAEWHGMAWWLARTSRVPVVTRLATPTYVLEGLNVGHADRAHALIRFMEADQARHSAAVYGPTRAIIDRVGSDWGLASVTQIPNAIDVAEVAAAVHRDPGVPLPDRFVAFLGRLERRKGIEPLGLALREVLKERSDIHAVLVGRDPEEDGGDLMVEFRDAVQPVAERVHLLGELVRSDALAVLARAELVVLPSLWESFGYVAVEALALGRPVIASAAGGFAEIIEHGVSGWLVPAGDADALAATMAARLDDPNTADVESAARQRASTFDLDRIAAEVESLLESCRRGPFTSSLYQNGYRRYFRPEEQGDPFKRIYAEKRSAVLAHFVSLTPGRVLDAGGGFGRLAAPLSARHRVTLADVSADMLAEARSRCGPEVDLVQCDARHLPFREGSFDAVLAVDLMCHFSDTTAGLAELARVTAARGEVVFDTTNARPGWVLAYPAYVNWRPRRLLRTLRNGGVLPEWRRLVRHHRPSEVPPAAQAAGLSVGALRAMGPWPFVKWHLWRAVKAR